MDLQFVYIKFSLKVCAFIKWNIPKMKNASREPRTIATMAPSDRVLYFSPGVACVVLLRLISTVSRV